MVLVVVGLTVVVGLDVVVVSLVVVVMGLAVLVVTCSHRCPPAVLMQRSVRGRQLLVPSRHSSISFFFTFHGGLHNRTALVFTFISR